MQKLAECRKTWQDSAIPISKITTMAEKEGEKKKQGDEVQYVSGCCSMLYYVVGYGNVFQRVIVRCSVL